jgi:DHA1 family tetracycline resistance protein-like MFS transporter
MTSVRRSLQRDFEMEAGSSEESCGMVLGESGLPNEYDDDDALDEGMDLLLSDECDDDGDDDHEPDSDYATEASSGSATLDFGNADRARRRALQVRWTVKPTPQAIQPAMTPPTPQQRAAVSPAAIAPRALSDLRKRLASKRFAQRVAGLPRTKLVGPRGQLAGRPDLQPPQPPARQPPGPMLTPEERRVVLQQRALSVLAALASGIGAAASMQIKLGLVDYDVGKMATSTGQLISLISLGNLVLGPIVAGMSDSFGRLPFMAVSVLARLWWDSKLFSVQSIERYQEFGVLAFGVLSAGAGSVHQAALDDMFAHRPGVSAQVQATNSAWISAVGLTAPIIGAELSRRSTSLALMLSAMVGALQLPVLLLGKETLHPSKRMPFQLRKADPLRNIMVLFRNGPGLRRLAITNIFFTLCTGVQQTMTSFQFGSLGWNPADQSYYGSFQSLLGIFSQGSVVVPMLKRLGPLGAFETGSLFSTLGYVLLSQAWRPLGATKLHKTVQLAVAMFMMVPGHVCGLAMRTMIVKQASEVTKGTGRGELNAALSGLQSLLGVVMPLAWGWLTKLFAESGVGTWWYNPGGQFLIAAALRMIARQLVITTPQDQLCLS